MLAPDPRTVAQGEFFNLNGSSSLAGGTLSTNFPELSVSLDAIVEWSLEPSRTEMHRVMEGHTEFWGQIQNT